MTTALLSTDNLSEEKNFPKVKIALATCKNVFGGKKDYGRHCQVCRQGWGFSMYKEYGLHVLWAVATKTMLGSTLDTISSFPFFKCILFKVQNWFFWFVWNFGLPKFWNWNQKRDRKQNKFCWTFSLKCVSLSWSYIHPWSCCFVYRVCSFVVVRQCSGLFEVDDGKTEFLMYSTQE